MIKKILSFFLGIIMFVTILCATFIFSIRSLLTGTTITNIITDAIDAELNITSDDYFNNLLGTTDFKVSEYFNEKEMQESFNNMITEYLKYYLGVESDYQKYTTDFQNLIEEASEKYTAETGKEIDEKLIDDYFTEIEESLVESKPTENPSMTSVFQIIFSNSIMITLIIIIIICGLLIFFLRGRKILTHIATVLIFNAIISGLFGKVISFVSDEDLLSDKLLTTISDNLVNVALVSLIVAIILIITNIIIKKLTNKNNQKVNISNNESLANQTVSISNENNLSPSETEVLDESQDNSLKQ